MESISDFRGESKPHRGPSKAVVKPVLGGFWMPAGVGDKGTTPGWRAAACAKMALCTSDPSNAIIPV